MNQRTCAFCGIAIERRHSRAIYCSKSCSAKASHRRDPEARKRHQARYRASAKGKAAKQRYLYTRTCMVCEGSWRTERRQAKYCSMICRDFALWGPRSCPWSPPMTALTLWVRPEHQTVEPSPPRLWVSGPCAWCGDDFTVHSESGVARYCSRHCSRKASKATRRARECGSHGTYTWAEVARKWMAIGKRCAYCDQPKRNDEIEPDHVVPLSRGGSNSITNVVPSCKPCNNDKRTLLLDEWYADRLMRGKAPRVLNPAFGYLMDEIAA